MTRNYVHKRVRVTNLSSPVDLVDDLHAFYLERYEFWNPENAILFIGKCRENLVDITNTHFENCIPTRASICWEVEADNRCSAVVRSQAKKLDGVLIDRSVYGLHEVDRLTSRLHRLCMALHAANTKFLGGPSQARADEWLQLAQDYENCRLDYAAICQKHRQAVKVI